MASAAPPTVAVRHQVLEVVFETIHALGVTMQPLLGDEAYSGPPDEDPRRFWVEHVAGQAEELGVQVGDLIWAVEGRVQQANPFPAIKAVLARKAEDVQLHVTLLRGFVDPRTRRAMKHSQIVAKSFSVGESLGLTLRPIGDGQGGRASVVVALVDGAQGERIGVLPGDAIISVGGLAQCGDAMPDIKKCIRSAKENDQAGFDIVFFRQTQGEGDEDDEADDDEAGEQQGEGGDEDASRPTGPSRAANKQKINVGDMFKKSVFGNMFKKKEGNASSSSSPSSSSSSSAAPSSSSGSNQDAGAKMNKVFGDLFKKKERAPAMGSDDAEATIASLQGQLDATKIAFADAERQLAAERKRHAQTVQQLVALRQKNAESASSSPAPEERQQADAITDEATTGDVDTALTAALGKQASEYEQKLRDRDALWIQSTRELLARVAAESKARVAAAIAQVEVEVSACADAVNVERR